jgi:hypothetical protein
MMKKIIFKILLITAIFSAPAMAGALQDSDPEGVEEVVSRDKDLFVFKTKRQFVGAKVEVFLSNGDLVTAQRLLRKKMIIDFGDATDGTYTIRVSKGDKTKEFQFVKN